MHIILRYPDGRRVDALLLSQEPSVMRVAIPGRNDTLELTLVRERWVDDDGQKVSIEAIVATAGRGDRPALRAGAAGGLD
jgi:hypothetical protein